MLNKQKRKDQEDTVKNIISEYLEGKKIEDDEVKKIAKKQGISHEKMKQNLLAEGKKLLNGK